MPGTLFVVATPIGNLEDITSRALRILRNVSMIAAEDTRRTVQLLSRYAITTPTTSLHEHNEARKLPTLISRLERGEDVALVSDAGTPTVSDPGERLIGAALDAGIRVEPVPGPNAIIAALSVAGLPAGTFAFLGFPPTRSHDRKAWFDRARSQSGTIVFFEAPHRIRETLETLQAAAGDCTVAVCRELTKVHEEVLRGPISRVLNLIEPPRGEYTVVASMQELGHMADNELLTAPGGPEMATELGVLTKSGRYTRRAAVSALARRYRIPPNEVYRRIESAKKSGE